MYMRSHADPSKATTYPQMIEYRSKSKLGPRAQRVSLLLHFGQEPRASQMRAHRSSSLRRMPI
eukprot:1139797-Pelagomonas_calceolata.AAC.5